SRAHPAPRHRKGLLHTGRAAGPISPPPEWERRRHRGRVKFIKMSTIPRHFGLKYKEESYMFKELEKVRQETKKDFLRFKQKLASKPAVDERPVHSLYAPGAARPERVSCAAARTSRGSPSAKGPAMSAAALLQEVLGGAPRPSGLGEAAAPGKTLSFRPRDFYLRSSAFLRHHTLKKPPVIASGFGTARPVVLLPPPEPPVKRRACRVLGSSRHAAPRPVLDLGREREEGQEVAPLSGPCMAKERKVSSISTEDGYTDVSSGRRKVRIRTHFMSESRAREAREAAGLGAQGEQESLPPSDAREAAWQALLPARVIPTSIEEIIASLQSEAQLASDQTIKELIRSILGQNYDIRMEDISLMGKMYRKTSSMQAETPEIQAEHRFQMGAEESQTNMHKELPEAMSSILHIEQEDIEWGTSEVESTVFKPQEILQVQPAEELSKPLEDGQPTSDSKEAKRVSNSRVASYTYTLYFLKGKIIRILAN
ncbi:hypothetical protein EGK_18131, partial [Macaca mulatta]